MAGSHRINELSESQTLALSRKVRELKAEGKDILSLTLGEPDFDTPAHIRQAAVEAIREGFTHYTPVAGIPELRKAAAEKFTRLNKLPYSAENIIISTGAKQSLINAVMSLVNPGDEVIIPVPYWVSYSEMVKMAGAKAVFIQTDISSKFKITPAQLEKALNQRSRMFIFSSPCNPSGAMYSRSELAALVEVFKKHPQVYILSDEIYEFISYEQEHVSIGSFPEVFERTITVNGVSKAFAMTGWRIGILGAAKWIADLCDKYQGQVTSGTSSISQRAALAALTGDLSPTKSMVAEFRNRRDETYKILCAIPGLKATLPEGAFYHYPDISGFFGKSSPDGRLIRNANDLAMYILDEGNVAVVSGEAFGTEDHIRLSFASSIENLRAALGRIKDCLAKLR